MVNKKLSVKMDLKFENMETKGLEEKNKNRSKEYTTVDFKLKIKIKNKKRGKKVLTCLEKMGR